MIDENADQLALAKWISAGLQIAEVRSRKGDAPYLLSNMIAKYSLAAASYRLSEGALRVLNTQDVNLSLVHTRARFYGKSSPFMYEHAIPAGLVRDRLFECDGQLQTVLGVLRQAGPVVMILRIEDQALCEAGVRAKMPEGWQWGDDPLARYYFAGLKLAEEILMVTGKLKR